MSVQGFNFGEGIVKYDYNHLDNAPIPEEMTVGSANQLISKLTETDKEPYLFRTAGGSLEIGDREKLKTVVGGSVGWNQLVQNGNFESMTGWILSNVTIAVSNNVATLTPTDANSNIGHIIQIYKGHKYFRCADFYGSSGNAFINWYGALTKAVALSGNWITISDIISNTYDNSSSWRIGIGCNSNSGLNEYKVKNVQVVDLTLLLGSTIADYLYTLETATAGAGVAKLKSWGFFTKDYYAYDTGSLKSVEGLSKHDTVGFNQWDEEWEVGTIDAGTGQPVSSSINLRSKNFIPIMPNTTYYGLLTPNMWMTRFYYDENYNYLEPVQTSKNGTFITPSNARYMKFRTESNYYPMPYNHDICINLHWDGERDGEYEEYSKHSYPLDSTLTLRGIPKLDANNSLYYDGDEYAADGTVTRRYGIVDLGTLNWNSAATTGRAFAVVPNMKVPSFTSLLANIITENNYVQKNANTTLSEAGQFAVLNQDSNIVFYYDGTLPSGYMVYELATPTTETANPYTETQIVDNWGTEEFVSTDIVPVGHETEYIPDLKAKLEVAPEAPNADGLYLMKRENGENSYVAYVPELPTDPAEDGTYTLKATKTSSGTALAWVADE